MRQLFSTTLVACIVGALAGITVSAVAQVPAQPPDGLATTAGINADRVDGLDAVKAASKKAKRRNRLIATDAKGFLPSNIIKAKWGLISGKPAFLADCQVGWNEVAGIPAGFADGSDDVGCVSTTQPATYTIGGFDIATVFADTPIGTDVELTILPEPGKLLEVTEEYFWRGSSSPGGKYPDLSDGMIRRELGLQTAISTPL